MAGRYPHFHMAGINDVFPVEGDYSYIKGSGNVVREYNACNKQGLAKQVFHCFMKRALEDVVENGDVLSLPLHDASILVEEIPEEIYKKRRAEGKLLHFSEIFAMGKAYDIIYRYRKNGRYLKWKVVVGKELYGRFIELVNSGKKYFGIAKSW